MKESMTIQNKGAVWLLLSLCVVSFSWSFWGNLACSYLINSRYCKNITKKRYMAPNRVFPSEGLRLCALIFWMGVHRFDIFLACWGDVRDTSCCGAVPFQDQLYWCVHCTGCVLHLQGDVVMVLFVPAAVIQIKAFSLKVCVRCEDAWYWVSGSNITVLG